MALPDPDTVYRLLKEAPGPSPWWCNQPISSTFGPLVWEELAEQSGCRVLVDAEKRPRLALPKYIWFRILDEGWMLLWSRRYHEDRLVAMSMPIVIQLLNLDHLRRLAEVEQWLAQKPRPVDPLFSIAPEFCATAGISAAYPEGTHEIHLPSAFARIPEFFIVTDNPTLPKVPGTASTCLYAVDPARQSVEVFPQDWFNHGKLDYGYQWITCATRDPITRKLLVSGIRIDNFILDETGKRIEQCLPR